MNRQGAKDAKVEPDRQIDELARAVIGAAIEVHRHLGPGFLEGVYEEALAVELRLRGIQFERQKPVPVGLLINFNVPALRAGIRRVVLSGPLSPRRSWRLGG